MLAACLGHGHVQFLDALVQVNLLKRLAHGFRAHLGKERAAFLLRLIRAVGFHGFAHLCLGKELIRLQWRVTRLNHKIVLVVNHALQMATGHVQHQAKAGRHALEEPNVRARHGQINVPHALATDASQRNLHPAAIAHHALVFNSLIFAAGAFPVLHRAEDALAKEAAFLRLEGAVVDGLGVFYLPLGPALDGVRRSHGDLHVVHQVHAFQAEHFAG